MKFKPLANRYDCPWCPKNFAPAWKGLYCCIIFGPRNSLVVLSMCLKSLTYDENYYLPAGFSYLMNNHPLLIPIILGLTLMCLDINFLANSDVWESNIDKYAFCRLFLYNSGNDVNLMEFWDRMTISFMSLLLAIHI